MFAVIIGVIRREILQFEMRRIKKMLTSQEERLHSFTATAQKTIDNRSTREENDFSLFHSDLDGAGEEDKTAQLNISHQ